MTWSVLAKEKATIGLPRKGVTAGRRESKKEGRGHHRVFEKGRKEKKTSRQKRQGVERGGSKDNVVDILNPKGAGLMGKTENETENLMGPSVESS